MARLDRRIGFIGAGNMGEAIVGALIQAKIFAPERIQVCDVSPERISHMEAAYGVEAASNSTRLFLENEIVILAVKPQGMEAVIREITDAEDYGVAKRTLLISIAAGTPIRKIESLFYEKLGEKEQKNLPIIRVMPNTPALVLAGMSGMSANDNARKADLETARTILESMGKVIQFDEEKLNAVTGVSGSGPAYVFYFIEAMIEGGVACGLSGADAAALTLETFKGAAALLEARGESPESLRRKVTSPGGTTEAALKVMEEKRVKEAIRDAVAAATRRGEELSR